MIVAPFSYLTAHHAVLNTAGAAGSEWGLLNNKEGSTTHGRCDREKSKIRVYASHLYCTSSREDKCAHQLQVAECTLILGGRFAVMRFRVLQSAQLPQTACKTTETHLYVSLEGYMS